MKILSEYSDIITFYIINYFSQNYLQTVINKTVLKKKKKIGKGHIHLKKL